MPDCKTSPIPFVFLGVIIAVLSSLLIYCFVRPKSIPEICPSGQSCREPCVTITCPSCAAECSAGQIKKCIDTAAIATEINLADTSKLCVSKSTWKTLNYLYQLTPDKSNLGANEQCKITLQVSKKETPNVVSETLTGFVSNSNNVFQINFAKAPDSGIVYPDGKLRWNSGTYWELVSS
jgi:hypothetical protein